MYAAGLSLVYYTKNPHLPTSEHHYRMIAIIKKGTDEFVDWWLGGGTDLTPTYLNKPDCILFHSTMKQVFESTIPGMYRKAKKTSDEYLRIEFRGENRGIGGVFYDDVKDRDARLLYKF